MKGDGEGGDTLSLLISRERFELHAVTGEEVGVGEVCH